MSEANQTTIVTPTITTIEYEKEYAVQVKSIDDLTDSSEYAFDSFYLNQREFGIRKLLKDRHLSHNLITTKNR